MDLLKSLQFLKELQQELNTQETDCQADPRFWVIRQEEWHGVPAGNEEDIHYYDSESCEIFESFEDLLNFIEAQEEDKDFLKGIESFDDLPAGLKDRITEVPVAKVSVIKEDTFFITKKDAKEHLRLNNYHYNKTAHTYAMTAWRSPSAERLWEILQTLDFQFLENIVRAASK